MTISLRVKLGQGFTLRAIVRLHVRLGMQAEASTNDLLLITCWSVAAAQEPPITGIMRGLESALSKAGSDRIEVQRSTLVDHTPEFPETPKSQVRRVPFSTRWLP
jgi:hypothetical protein